MIQDGDFLGIINNAEHLTSLVRLLRENPNMNELELRTLRAISDIWELLRFVQSSRQQIIDANTILKAIKSDVNH